MLTQVKPVEITTIRWKKKGCDTIARIDGMCDEYGVSRATAITMICDRLIELDKSLSNPLTPSPKILTD
jgi:hypothetical protein